MQCTKRKTARTRLLQSFAAVALTAGALLLVAGTVIARFSASSIKPLRSTLRRSPQLPDECSSMLLTACAKLVPSR